MFDVTYLDKYGNTVTNLTQWDLNQTLYIEDHGFTTPPQFHFCNKNSEKALVVQSTVDDNGLLQVEVPNVLLIEPYTITVYVYLSEDDSSKTVEYIQIPVRQRPQPDSFEYEDNVVLIDVQELANEIRALNESISSAEEERINAETIRIANETERQSAETDRKDSETTRTDAEIERVEAENIRKENETIRVENEDERKTAEQSRVNAETERVDAENVRKENEENRLTAETERTEAEIDRLEAETNRVSVEAERIEAENERIDAESARVTAENERIDAEAIRQAQEEERQTNSATAIQNANQATDRANVAAEACEGIIEGTGLIPSTEKGLANGVATLDENGKVPMSQIPDDISGNADGIIYDNTNSGLSATNVQSAIDEILSNPIDAKTLNGHEVEYFAPKTDLERHIVTRYTGDTEEKINALYDSFHTNAKDGEWYRARVYHNVGHSVLGGGTWYLEGMRNAEKYGWQKVTYTRSDKKTTYSRSIQGSTTWGEWVADFTTAGGTVTGDIIQDVEANGKVVHRIKNGLREIALVVQKDGKFQIYDTTNNDDILTSDVDGTTTIDATASGNLPLTGGEIDGNVYIGNVEKAQKYENRLRNANRNLSSEINANGNYVFWDSTNSDYVFQSTADGTNTFNGEANGNLPLSGGEIPWLYVQGDSNIPFRIYNNGGSNSSFVQFHAKDKKNLGRLGFDGVNNPCFYSTSEDSNGQKMYSLHHDGNSAKVVVATTTPVEGATATEPNGTIVFSK